MVTVFDDVVLDESVERFLADCKPSTALTYRSSLKHFQKFISGFEFSGEVVGSCTRMLDLISADQAKPVREKQFIARAIMKGFKEYLETQGFENKGFAPKGILTRVGAVQSFAKYYEVVISTGYTQMPVGIVQTKSYPWSKESFGRFIGYLETPLYRALEAVLYQSGLGIGDALALTYEVIRDDFESGILPICLDLVRHKTSVPHVSFLSTEAADLLRVYLGERDSLADSDLLFPIKARSVQGYFALRAQKLLGGYVGRNPAGPHSVRKFFRKSLVNSGCPESYAEYWEGHNLRTDLRKTYTAMDAEEWRLEFRKYMKALSFKIIEPDENVARATKVKESENIVRTIKVKGGC